jgi:hypothetical protein
LSRALSSFDDPIRKLSGDHDHPWTVRTITKGLPACTAYFSELATAIQPNATEDTAMSIAIRILASGNIRFMARRILFKANS